MSADGAACFAHTPVPSRAATTAAGAASTPLTHPPSRSSASPTVLGLRGGMREGDVEDWGPADVCHKYDLSRLVADCPPHQVSTDEGPALILVNYELPRSLMERLWFNATLRVCADGAINRLYAAFDTDEDRARFIPEYVRGDLDSVEDKVIEYYQKHGTKIIKDNDQDTTDLEKCISLIKQNTSLDAREVVVLGAFGGRLDHEFSHYHVLFKFSRIKLVLLSPGRAAFVLVPGRHAIDTKSLGRSCGLIPLAGPAKRVWTSGLEWDLDGADASSLTFGQFISTSNRIRPHAEHVYVNTSAPLLWVSDFTYGHQPFVTSA